MSTMEHAGLGSWPARDAAGGPGFLPSPLRAALDDERAVACVLAPDLTIGYVNDAWRRFADANGGGPLFHERFGVGYRLVDAIHGPLRDFFVQRLLESLDLGRPWEHTYECSSAAVYRQFHMKCMPLPQRSGLVLLHSLVEERPHDSRDRQPHPPDESLYLNDNGLLRQCSYCRRTRRRDGGREQWDWIPAWVEHSPRHTTHGVCPLCFTYYTGAVAPSTG